MHGDKYKVLEARSKSIKDYIESMGIATRSNGSGRYFCSSPFSKDTNWSFCIYPTNTYYDWSTGKGGDIIDLVRNLEGCTFKEAVNILMNNVRVPKVIEKPAEIAEPKKAFDYKKFITHKKDEIDAINAYAASRSITDGYECGVFFTKDEESDNWVRNPAIMFVHRDVNCEVCGVKFRKIKNDGKDRFSARGKQGFYILDVVGVSSFYEKVVYLVESETSANSLWEYFKKINKPAVVISMGGVASVPQELPKQYKDLKKFLIIDFDGNEKLYKERLSLYSHLDAEPIRLKLPKGEDINSLYNLNKIDLIEYLLK